MTEQDYFETNMKYFGCLSDMKRSMLVMQRVFIHSGKIIKQ